MRTSVSDISGGFETGQGISHTVVVLKLHSVSGKYRPAVIDELASGVIDSTSTRNILKTCVPNPQVPGKGVKQAVGSGGC